MSANVKLRIFQVVVALQAFHFATGGGYYLVRGVAGLSIFTPTPLPVDPSDPMWANIDYMYRALAGIWCALGAMVAYLVPTIERRGAWFALIQLCVFAMGIGRLLSLLSFGPTPGNSTGAMVAEFVLPPLYVFWQQRVAKACREATA